MQPRYGLKLWSVNAKDYLRPAAELYEQGVFDYIELYVVPGAAADLASWRSLDVPYIIHCPHFAHGFNLAQAQCFSRNCELFEEVRLFADTLCASSIIIHGGMGGHAQETARQLRALREPRALLENKPHHVLRDDGSLLLCRGALPEEIALICAESGCGFCLDFEHALCSANTHRIPPQQMIEDFMRLNPAMFHLAGIGDRAQETDAHRHICADDGSARQFLSYVQPGQRISVETVKDFRDKLDDFCEDIALLRDWYSEGQKRQ